MPIFDQKLSLITLAVRDLANSRRFYSSIFGWKEHPMSNDRVVFYYLPSGALGLYGFEDLKKDAGISAEWQDGYKPVTLAINQKSEKEVDEKIKSLRARKVKIVKAPVRAAWGGYHAYFADPDDYLWEVAFNPFDSSL